MNCAPREANVAGLILAGVAALMLSQTAVVQAELPNFEDVTSTRLVGDIGILRDDTEEKDVAVGDLDKDGDTDVIVARKTPFTVSGPRADVLLMNEDGVLTERTDEFAPALNSPTDARDVIMHDLDGDTWLDVVIGNAFGQHPKVLMNQGEIGGVWQGLVDESSRIPNFPSLPQFCQIGIGDVTGDQAPDIYFADYENNLEDRLLINDGSGFFTDETMARIAPGLVTAIFATGAEIVDMNMDGWNDIVVSHALEDVHILINDGAGNFPTEQEIPSDQAYQFKVGDLNDDQRPDIYIVQDGQDRVVFNNSTNGNNTINMTTFNLNNSPRTSNFGGNVEFGDVDKDFDFDVFVSDVDIDIAGCDREGALLENPGNGQVFDPYGPDQGFNIPTFDCKFIDIDGDGWLDLYSGVCSGTKLFRQIPPAAGIADVAAAPSVRTALGQNRPNPFNPNTVIEFEIAGDPQSEVIPKAVLAIYDVQGRLVSKLLDGPTTPGVHQIRWDARNSAGQRVSPGVYFYRLQTRT